ncbi:hypothetical protein BDQ17DRAFT_1433811 [Cyathus striatus]|nr:hypothetical protein BDQ17DRAFT_1433811 [Cyathus striatus]
MQVSACRIPHKPPTSQFANPSLTLFFNHVPHEEYVDVKFSYQFKITNSLRLEQTTTNSVLLVRASQLLLPSSWASIQRSVYRRLASNIAPATSSKVIRRTRQQIGMQIFGRPRRRLGDVKRSSGAASPLRYWNARFESSSTTEGHSSPPVSSYTPSQPSSSRIKSLLPPMHAA